MKKLVPSCLAIGLLAVAAQAHAQDLSFTLTSNLKSSAAGSCPGASTDADGDCLDDAMEQQLAGLVSPYYLWDEGEDCNWYSANDTDHSSGQTDGQLQNIPRYYFQVRPIKKTGAPAGYPLEISKWTRDNPNRWLYWVRIHYFFNYPRDCGSPGHQGDNEGVYFDMYSNDLQHWGLGNAWYPRHDFGDVNVSSAYVANITRQAGARYPVVLADDKGHGSWEGLAGTSDRCGNDSQGHLFSLNYYCVVGASIGTGISLHNYVFPDTSRNIGEPTQAGSDGKWNANILTVGNLGTNTLFASTAEDVQEGWGAATEFWSNVVGTIKASYNSFCGWECTSLRSDNLCNHSVHGHTECTGSSMWSKVEKAPFSRF